MKWAGIMARDRFITPFAYDLEATDLAAERRKARELRASQWWKRQCAKGRCYWCAAATPASELTMDHIVPIARGGKSTKGNVVTSCKACNSKKKQLLPMEWEAYVQAVRSRDEGAVDAE
jgi:hypothetical protein